MEITVAEQNNDEIKAFKMSIRLVIELGIQIQHC